MIASLAAYSVIVIGLSLLVCASIDKARIARHSDWWDSEADRAMKRYGIE